MANAATAWLATASEESQRALVARAGTTPRASARGAPLLIAAELLKHTRESIFVSGRASESL